MITRLSERRKVEVRTLVLATAGALLFLWLGLPAPWLCGAMVVIGAIALSGRLAVAVPRPLREASHVVLGVTIGAGVTPEALAGIVHWPLSMLILIATVPAIVGSAQLFLVRVMGWRTEDALLAAVPGVLSYVLAIAAERKLEVAPIALAQTSRLFLTVLVVPLAVGGGVAPIAAVAAPPISDAPTLVLMLGLGAAAGWALIRLGVPAGLLLGALAASALLHGTGLVTSRLPAFLVVPALVIVGAVIGSRFADTSPATLRQGLIASVGAFLIAAGVATGMALLTSVLLDLPWRQAVLAFAPGGLDSTVVMAFALGLEPAFVAAHQLVRFVGLAVALPFVLAQIDRTRAGS